MQRGDARAPAAHRNRRPDRCQQHLVSGKVPPVNSTSYCDNTTLVSFSEPDATPERVRSRLCATQRTIASTITPAPGMIHGGKTVAIAAPMAAPLPMCRRHRNDATSISAATTAYQIDEPASRDGSCCHPGEI